MGLDVPTIARGSGGIVVNEKIETNIFVSASDGLHVCSDD